MSAFYVIPLIGAFSCGVYIAIWWRDRLKKVYIEELKHKKFVEMEELLKGKEDEIVHLKEHNEFLAKMIHKDNKLIPAMELAVRTYLQAIDQDQNDIITIRSKGMVLLEQLKVVSQERLGVLSEYHSENKELPPTGVFQIDNLIAYMFNRAENCGIELNMEVYASIKFMTEKIISVSDLRTLLADLIENAIIATKACHDKKILISLGVVEGSYQIDIFDSGVPFEAETINQFGRQKTTTHADTGGNGIGLMTIYEILQSYQASFIIEGIENMYTSFSKRVTVKFDDMNQYIIGMGGVKKVYSLSEKR